jgi:ribonuclease D
MVEYAAKDAFYLIPLAEIIEKQLKGKNRLAWVVEECDLLSRVRPVETQTFPLFLNFKGAGRLKPRNLAILEGLLLFRRQLAERYDKPLFKVIGNRTLLILANRTPVNMEELMHSKALSARQTERFGATILGIIHKAQNIPENELPIYPREKPSRYRPAIARRIKALKTWKEEKAGRLKLDPSLVLNKMQTIAIASTNPLDLETLSAVDYLKKWQTSEFGRDILDVLAKN